MNFQRLGTTADDHAIADAVARFADDALAPLAQRIAAEMGAIDILVNNAGMQHVSPLLEFPAGKWDELLAVNLSAPFHAIQA
ncbi:SDR family NAD(P)-dependent oxidoreductase, partial [Acinetobacter baumannii]|nr:SDR family NAD(P)-dependent oxidoreductase [Acinetobacter baumannii]MCW1766358.1 SDR family NAD(P)-dependent oxidoreductase [Acinetobacter baumannii]